MKKFIATSSVLLISAFFSSDAQAKIKAHPPIYTPSYEIIPKFYMGIGMTGQHAEHNYAFTDVGTEIVHNKFRKFQYISELAAGFRFYFPSTTFVGIGVETRLGTHKLDYQSGTYALNGDNSALETQPSKLYIRKNHDTEINIQVGTQFGEARFYGKLGLGYTLLHYGHESSQTIHYKSAINKSLHSMFVSPGIGIEKQISDNCSIGLTFSVPICKQNNVQKKPIVPGSNPEEKDNNPANLSKISGRTTLFQMGLNFKFYI